MSINKGKDKIKPYPVCGLHGVLCSCARVGNKEVKSKNNKRYSKK